MNGAARTSAAPGNLTPLAAPLGVLAPLLGRHLKVLHPARDARNGAGGSVARLVHRAHDDDLVVGVGALVRAVVVGGG